MISETEIVKILCEINDYKTMRCLINEIFTPVEIQDVALRWRLMQLLNEGISQRKIAERLGISLCKITRGSKILKNKRSVSKKLLNQNAGDNNALRTKTKRSPG